MTTVKSGVVSLLLLFSISSFAGQWTLSRDNQVCKVSQNIQLSQSGQSQQKVNLQFVVDSNKHISLDIRSSSQPDEFISRLIIAESEYLPQETANSYRLGHNDAREVLMILDDFAKTNHSGVEMSLEFGSDMPKLLDSKVASNVFKSFEKNSFCFDSLVSALTVSSVSSR